MSKRESDRLYLNKFIDPEVYDISESEEKQREYIKRKKEFRRFMEGRRPNFDQLNHPRSMNIKYYAQGGIAGLSGPEVAVLGEQGPEAVIPLAPNDPLNTNPIGGIGRGGQQGGSSVGGRALNASSRDNNTSGGGNDPSGASGGGGDRFVQEFHTYVHIDSRDRDPAIWPTPSHYRVLLKRNFTNVKEIKLKSTEFPNTQQLIRSTPLSQANNRVFWNIEDDGDQLYVATLVPGSYDATSFAKELSSAMSTVLRSNTTLTSLEERQQNFTVSIDTITDIVSFSSVTFNAYSTPFTVTFGSNVVRVISNEIAKNISAGDRIVIEEAVDIGGIPDTDLNGEHIVTEVRGENEFRFEADSTATSTVTQSGGTAVQIGKGLRFKLLWSREGTPADILGFEQEDTDFALVQENTRDADFETLMKIDESNDDAEIEELTKTLVHVFESEADPDSTIFSVITTTINHGLTSGDRIFIETYDHTYGVYDRETDLIDQGISEEDTGTISKYEALVNNPAGHIVTVVDAVTFKIPVEYTDPPLENIINAKNSLTSDYRNSRIIQRSLNKALKLSGENYIYFTALGMESMLTTVPIINNVTDVFYILQLNAPPGSVMFNSFIGNPKRFYEAALPFLDEMEFRFVTHDGEEFNFNDQDHSFTIEIVEAIQKIEGSELSSQIGATT